MSEALEIVERAAFDDGEMRAYDKFWDAISRQKTIEGDIKREAKKAIAEAKAETEKAKAETEEAKAKLKQDKFDTARKLKAMNVMTAVQIAEATGLTAEEIMGL